MTQEQTDTVVALAFIQFIEKIRPYERHDVYDYSETLSALNWIATCFVSDPIGDAAAAALSIEEDQVTFYIATHRGQPRPEDRAFGEHFIQSLRETISQTDALLATNQLIASLVPRLYNRFSRKVDMIRKMDKTSEPLEVRFNQVVDEWAKAKNIKLEDSAFFAAESLENGSVESAKARNMEDSAFFMAESLGNGSVESENGNQRLKSVFNALASMVRAEAKIGPQDDVKRLSNILIFSVSALTLVESRFLTNLDNPWSEWRICDHNLTWILQLRRRLRRLADYYKNAFTFVQIALPFFRRILKPEGVSSFQQGGSEVKIVWVGERLLNPLSDTVIIKQSPETVLNGCFMKPGSGVEDEPLPAIHPEVREDLDNLWQEDVAINLCLHSEMQMIVYLEANHIPVHQNCIGSSKMMCRACDAYVKKANANRERIGEEPWLLSETTSKKVQHRWLIPQTPIGQDVASDLREEFRCSVDELHVILHVKNRRRTLHIESALSESGEAMFTSSDWCRSIFPDSINVASIQDSGV